MYHKSNSVSPRKLNERPAVANISLFPHGKLISLSPPGIPRSPTTSSFAPTSSSSSNAPHHPPLGLASSAPSPRVRASVPAAKVLPQSPSRFAEMNTISRIYRSFAGAAGGQDHGYGLSNGSGGHRPTSSSNGHGPHHVPTTPTTNGHGPGGHHKAKTNGHSPEGHWSTGHHHGMSHSHHQLKAVTRLSRGEPSATSARDLKRTSSSHTALLPKTPSPSPPRKSNSAIYIPSPSYPPSRASAIPTRERGSNESNQGGGEPSPRQRLLTRTDSSSFASAKARQSSRPESNSIAGSGRRVTGRQVMSKQPMYKARIISQRSDHLPLLHEDVAASSARSLTHGDASSRSSDSFGTPPLESFGAMAGSSKPKSTLFPRVQPPLVLMSNLSTTGDSSDIRSVSEDGQSLPPPVRGGAGFHFHTGIFWPIWSLIGAFWNLYYWYKPPIPSTTPTEPMTLIANERTCLGWQKCAVWMFLLTRGTLWGASMQPVLTLFLLFAAFRNWNCRRAMLYYCIPLGMGRYDTLYLPCIVFLGVFAGIIIEAYRNSQTVVMSLG